jgi:hypothetical protein
MFLVDGSHVFGHNRERLVHALANLARAFAAPSTVVFGGVPGPCAPLRRRGVRVLFAGARHSVSGRILELIAHDSRAAPVTIVTADPHLATCARDRGARVASLHLLGRALERVYPSTAASNASSPSPFAW